MIDEKFDNAGSYMTGASLSPEQIAQLAAVESQSNAIIKSGEGVLTIEGCTLTPVGLDIPDSLTEKTWEHLSDIILGLEASIQWILGDLWAFAEYKKYGEDTPDGQDTKKGKRKTLAEKFGKSPKTLSNWASVCKNYPDQSSRHRELSFGHHEVVASNDDRLELLQLAYAEDGKIYSVAKFRDIVNPKPAKADTIEREFDKQEHSRDAVLSHAAKKKNRKQWLTFAQAQAEKWSAVANQIEAME